MTTHGTPPFPAHVPLVLIVSGPAGAGKTSVVKGLLESSDKFMRAITCTCRPPRRGEVDGVDYHFQTPDEFGHKLRAGEFLEHAKVYGFDYGMPASNLKRAIELGKDLVINIDVQGAATIRKRAAVLSLSGFGAPVNPAATLSEIVVSVFIMPPSLQELEKRLKKRGTEDEETIRKRLAVVREEMKRWPEYDYVLVSGSLQDDQRRMQAIVAAERMKVNRLELFTPHE